MKLIRWLLLIAFASPVMAQNTRWDYATYTTQAQGGNLLPVYTIPGALISFYNEPDGTLANTYNSATSTSACSTGAQVVLNGSGACVSAADDFGNFGAWFLPGQYMATITVSDNTSQFFFTVAAVSSSGGSCGPLPGDSSSTNCGNGNDVGNTGTAVQTFGFENVDGTNSASSVVANGLNNFTGAFTGSDGVAIGLTNFAAPSGGSMALNGAHMIGNSNLLNVTSAQTVDGGGVGNCDFNGNSPVELEDVGCFGDGSVTNVGLTGDVTLQDVYGWGNEAVGQISGSIEDVIGLGNGPLNVIGDGSSELIGIGTSACSFVAANSDNLICIGPTGFRLGPNSSDVIQIGRSVGNYGNMTMTDSINIGIGKNTASFQVKIGDPQITQNLSYGLQIAGTIYSAAGTPLPSCTSAINGGQAVVSDATAPTYLGAYTSGGSVEASVLCNGTSWVTH